MSRSVPFWKDPQIGQLLVLLILSPKQERWKRCPQEILTSGLRGDMQPTHSVGIQKSTSICSQPLTGPPSGFVCKVCADLGSSWFYFSFMKTSFFLQHWYTRTTSKIKTIDKTAKIPILITDVKVSDSEVEEGGGFLTHRPSVN